MELGALVCTARSPRCDACPIAECCAWRAAGYPEHSGPTRAVQPRYEGSDRQVRGLVMARLRESEVPVPRSELDAVWPDAVQRKRAIAGLVADGLAIRTRHGFALPD
jgi:A/G-specific adenine glycosylase